MDYITLIKRYKHTPDDRWLQVSIKEQQISLFETDHCLHIWPVSTAARGTGQQNGSFQTPLGAHRIADKIGADSLPCSVFVGREDTGECADILTHPISSDKDQITSRILWLTGLEPGFNLGSDVDTRQRYIYIHGTPEEGLIGQPVSHGCIRMKNQDVIQLFDLIQQETLVYIAESD